MARDAGTAKASWRINLLVAIFVGVLFATNLLQWTEWRLYDARLEVLPFGIRNSGADDLEDPRIIMVAIDDKSLGALGRWPWPRDVHARLIENLGQAGARVVAFDVEFPEAGPDPAADRQLSEAARKAGNVAVGVHGQLYRDVRPGLVQAEYIMTPAPSISSAVKTGHLNLTPDSDGIIRRTLLAIASDSKVVPSLDLVAASMYLGVEPPLWDGRSPYIELAGRRIPVDARGRMLMNLWGDADTYPVVSYVDVLNGTHGPEFFKDKIVIVAPWAAGMNDLHTFASLGTFKPGAFRYAYGTETILDRAFTVPAPRTPTLLGVMLAAFLTGLLFFRLNPWKGAFVLVLLVVSYAVGNTIVLGTYGLLVDLVHPVIGIALAYLANLGYRLIVEQRHRQRITATFQRYVDPEVVKEILAAGEEALRLGGVRRPVTVLFLDVRGFTPLSEKLQPEEVVDVLNRNFEMITRVIFKYGGTLDKFIGDAVMALFNAPLDLPDHPLRAVLAAREIQEGAGAVRAEIEARYGSSVHFGIGINTGEAVVGNIGSSARMDYTAIGDAVNLAARLESNARPGQVLISESTWRAVRDRVETEPVGPIMVKGKSEPVNVYLVTVPGGAASAESVAGSSAAAV